AQNPAKPGDTIIVYATGLGVTNPNVDAGTVAPTSPLPRATNDVTATAGGVAANVLYAGLAPGLVGFYQINLTIPTTVPVASQIPVAVTAAGLSSSAVLIDFAASK